MTEQLPRTSGTLGLRTDFADDADGVHRGF
jgi:hypothetical protein